MRQEIQREIHQVHTMRTSTWNNCWSMLSSTGRVDIGCLQVRRVWLIKRVCNTAICLGRNPLAHYHSTMGYNCCRKASSYVGFSGESVLRFTMPQAKWPAAPILWTIYRIFLAIYLTVWLILILVAWGMPPYYSQADSKAKWLIYVSNWSFLAELLYLITMAVGNIYYHITHGCRNVRVGDEESGSHGNPDRMIPMDSANDSVDASMHQVHEELPWYFKLAWLLQSIVFTSSLFVVLLFYILVFNPGESVLSVYNFHVHGVNLILVVLDVCLAATPVRLLHFIYPCSLALVYTIFTVIYWAAGGLNEFGGTAIYNNSLDWATIPGKSALILALTILIAGPLIHLMWYLVYRIRTAISQRLSAYCWAY